MAATDNLIYAITLVLSISAVFMLTQAGMTDVAREYGGKSPTLVSCGQNALNGVLTTDCSTNGNYAINLDVNSKLVQPDSEVNPDTGDIFTDTFTAARSWLSDKLGIDFVVDLMFAPSDFLIAIKVPSSIAYSIGVIFYVIMLILIVAFIIGRF